MKYRKLRIAWSVVWGIVAVLLVALWVRSYWRVDGIYVGWRGVPYNVLTGADHGRAGITLRDYDITPGTNANPLFLIHDGGAIVSDSFIADRDPDGGIPGRLWFRIVRPDAQHYPELLIPLWFPPLVVLAIAALPFIWQNRFCLRTLLIATTLVAIGLGLIVWLSARPPTCRQSTKLTRQFSKGRFKSWEGEAPAEPRGSRLRLSGSFALPIFILRVRSSPTGQVVRS